MSGDLQSYKLSIFNIYTEIDQYTVDIYNTLHDSAVLVDREMLLALTDKSIEVEPSALNSLVLNRVLVSTDFDERQYFRYYINKMKYAPRRATFVLSLTSGCNLCCSYCFEGQSSNRIDMSSDVATKAIQYIADSFHKHSSIKQLDIAFFGGEPLLNRVLMTSICKNVSNTPDICDAVRYTLISNLTLLKDIDIKLIKDYHFSNVQVALDGPESIHDRRRVFKSGQGSFRLVTSNIIRLVESGVKVILILNFDKENWHSYDDLVSFITDYLPREQMEFVLNPISRSLCNSSCDMRFMNSAEEAGIFLDLYRKFKENGILIQVFGQNDMICMLNTDVSCIIDPEGTIYKCCQMLGKPEYRVGSIFNSIHSSLSYSLLLDEPWLCCLEEGCAYLPICGGGCRIQALISKGDLGSVLCQKEQYFDLVFKEILKDHLKQLMEGGTQDEETYCSETTQRFR